MYLRYMEWHSSDVCSVTDTIPHSFSLQGTPGLPGPPGPVGPPGERVRFLQFMFWKDQVMPFLYFLGFFPFFIYLSLFKCFFQEESFLSASPLERQKQKGWKHLRGGKFPRQLLVARMGSVRIGLLPALTRLSAAFTPGAVHPLGRALPRDSALLSSLHRCCCRESLWNSA